jgi:hypothetical protein
VLRHTPADDMKAEYDFSNEHELVRAMPIETIREDP